MCKISLHTEFPVASMFCKSITPLAPHITEPFKCDNILNFIY